MGELNDKFEKIGARVKVVVDPLAALRIDVRRDRQGEFFELRHDADTKVRVLDARPHDAHLVLMAGHDGPRGSASGGSKFLCGHDERSWFVAAVPEGARVSTVQDAKDALKPAEVWEAIRQFRVPLNQRDRRKTKAFLRQGEWFFLPRPWLNVPANLVLIDEPIRRGAGKPHLCQFLYRQGGETVHVCPRYPNGLKPAEFHALSQKERDKHRWRLMTRDARVFVKGKIRHPDHATLRLPYWHQVFMNTETRARAMREVAFLD
jgi:hypothetical protein